MAGPKQIAQTVVHTGDRLLSDIQARVQAITTALRFLPFLKGRVISVNLVASTGTTINHALGVPAAFMVIRQNYDGTGSAASVVESGTSYQAKIDLRSQLSVVSSANCLVDLWFYPRASVIVPSGKTQAP